MINLPFSPAPRHVPRTNKATDASEGGESGELSWTGQRNGGDSKCLSQPSTACNNSQKNAEIVAFIIILMACVRHETTNLFVFSRMRFHSGSIQPECQNVSSNIWRHYHRYVELGQVNMQEKILPIYLMFFLNVQFVEQILPNIFGKTVLTCFGTQCTGKC